MNGVRTALLLRRVCTSTRLAAEPAKGAAKGKDAKGKDAGKKGGGGGGSKAGKATAAAACKRPAGAFLASISEPRLSSS